MKVYTIRDIARLAGVSVTTVSRVLNHRPDVNPETRIRVEKIIQENHFVGNTNARGLKQRPRREMPDGKTEPAQKTKEKGSEF